MIGGLYQTGKKSVKGIELGADMVTSMIIGRLLRAMPIEKTEIDNVAHVSSGSLTSADEYQ